MPSAATKKPARIRVGSASQLVLANASPPTKPNPILETEITFGLTLAAANRAAGYFHVQDAAAWHLAWSDAEVEVSPLIDEPWGMREFTLHDPSGNKLRVGQNR